MNRKSYQVASTATIVVLMTAFLSVIFFACANPSFAATGKKKSTTVARTSAVEHTEARIKKLEGALKLTEEQQESWNNLTKVMRENAQEMDALTKEKHEGTKNMNAVERMKFYSLITESQLNHQKKLIPVFEALYSGMSDEQKKITDTIFKTGRHGKHKFN